MQGFEGLDDWRTLELEQLRIAQIVVPEWQWPTRSVLVAGLFVAFARGEQGPGAAGDSAVVGAVAVTIPNRSVPAPVQHLVEQRIETIEEVVVSGQTPAEYRPGMLAAREGSLLLQGVDALFASGVQPDLVMVDATGLDHPRRCGLAVQLGYYIDTPTVGVTHRPLLASGDEPGQNAPECSSLRLNGAQVAQWVRTHDGVRPVVAHAGWRTTPQTAAQAVLMSTCAARTPEPLRRARMLAREARSRWLD